VYRSLGWDKGGTVRAGDYNFVYGKGNENHQLRTGYLYTTEWYQQLRELEFISERVSYIVLRGRWCNIIILNVPAPSEEKSDYSKGSGRTIKKNAEALVVASKETGLEVNADKTKYMVMSRDQNAGQSHKVKINNSFFERVEEFIYLGRTLTDQNSIQEEIKSRLKSGMLAIIRCRIFCLPVC